MKQRLKQNKFNLGKVLHQIRFYPKQRVDIFLGLPHEKRATVLIRLGKHLVHDLLAKLNDDDVVVTLEHLDPDEITDILQSIGKKRRQAIINLLSDEAKKDVQILSEFNPETAAGLMNLDYIQIDENDVLAVAAKKFKRHEKRTGRLPTIIVTHNGYVSGYVPGHELGFAKPGEKVKKYTRRIGIIPHSASKKRVLEQFRAHPHNKVVVIGDEKNVMGIIYSDDILRILEEQESASLYDFAGLHKEESVVDDVKVKVKFRYKWLIVNLATAFLAAFTVGLFDKTIAKYVLLAVYMPIVAGMGGNAAVQTLAVIVRGIALKQIELASAWPILRREMGAAFINGIINGIIVAGVILIFNQDVRMALILGSAMLINLLVAGFFGTMTPLIMKKLGKDPAASATIFITTATDVLGFLTFLGLATIFLK